MPVEIIRKILAERTRKAAEQAAKTAAIQKARSERIATETQLATQKENKRKLFVAQQTERILNESFILAGLTRINDELLKNGRIVGNSDGVSLVWNEVDRGRNDYEYSYIDVQINPDNELVIICGENTYKLQRGHWKNKKAVETALAQAFLDPGRHEYIENEPADDGVHGQDSGR